MHAMAICHGSDIVLLEVGHTPGDVLTRASSFANEEFDASTTCNTVERFLDESPDFTYLLKRTF